MMTRPVLILCLLWSLAGCANLPGPTAAGGDLFKLQEQAARNYQKKNYQAALPLYTQLSKRVPGDALTWFQLGNVQAHLKHPDAAIKAYRQALTLNPKLARAWHNMGLIQLREAAATYTEMAANVPPVDPLQADALHKAQVLLQLLDVQVDKENADQPATH